MRSRTDAELLEAIVARDVAAFGELYDRYAARLHALCRRVLGEGRGDAEEVVQDAFVQAWQQASRFDGSRGSVLTWLFLIARSRAVDRLRTLRGQPGQTCDHLLEAQPAAGRDPERAAADLESARRVRRQVEDLPASQRVPLELAFFEGLTHTEIAAILKQPLGTVKTRIRLALIKLRDPVDAAGVGAARERSPFTVVVSQYLSRAMEHGSSPPLAGLTVMIVDDDRDTLEVVQTVLESEGARVVAKSSAAAALMELRVSWPDVLLTDIRMPHMDGRSLADEARRLARDANRPLPIVAFTGYAAEAPPEPATEAFTARLLKPVWPPRVIDTVARLCGRTPTAPVRRPGS